MNKKYRISVYRALRKFGVQKEEISENLNLTEDLKFDDRDWLCFIFLVESRIDIEFSNNEIKSIQTVGDMIRVMERN